MSDQAFKKHKSQTTSSQDCDGAGSSLEASKAEIIQKVKHLLEDSSDRTECNRAARRIIQLCQRHPSLATEHYNFQGDDNDKKCTILEDLCLRQVNVDDAVIEDFCTQFPETLSVECNYAVEEHFHYDRGGRLPLHCLCGPALEFRRNLFPIFVALYPEAVKRRNLDDNLPIHQLFVTYHHFIGFNNVDARNVEALDALLCEFPESLVMGGQIGIKPFQYVLSLDLPPGLTQCVVKHFNQGVSNWQVIDDLFLPVSQIRYISERICGILAQLIQQLKSLDFRPMGQDMTFDPEGWVLFCRSFTSCSQLTHLEIELPYYLFCSHPECHAAFAETLPQLVSLESLIVSLKRGLHDNDETPPDLASPFAELLRRQGNLAQLIIRDGVDMDPDPILQAITDNPQAPLTTLDLRSVTRDCDVTQELADLIASNGSLQSLSLRYVYFQQPPVFEAFAHNTHIKSIRLPGLIAETNDDDSNDDDNDQEDPYQRLSSVLYHYNCTLEEVFCSGASFQEMESLEYKQIQHYALLNRFGRAKLRLEAATGSSCRDLVQLLSAVLNDEGLQSRQNTRTSVVYGLMRDSPDHWCSSSHC